MSTTPAPAPLVLHRGAAGPVPHRDSHNAETPSVRTAAGPWATLHALARDFADRAAALAPYARGASAAWRDAGLLLVGALALADDEVLTIADAAREAGWTYEGLRRRVVREPGLNVGTARAPRVTRGALRALAGARGARAASSGAAESARQSARNATRRGAACASPLCAPSAEPSRLAAIVAGAVATRAPRSAAR